MYTSATTCLLLARLLRAPRAYSPLHCDLSRSRKYMLALLDSGPANTTNLRRRAAGSLQQSVPVRASDIIAIIDNRLTLKSELSGYQCHSSIEGPLYLSDKLLRYRRARYRVRQGNPGPSSPIYRGPRLEGLRRVGVDHHRTLIWLFPGCSGASTNYPFYVCTTSRRSLRDYSIASPSRIILYNLLKSLAQMKHVSPARQFSLGDIKRSRPCCRFGLCP